MGDIVPAYCVMRVRLWQQTEQDVLHLPRQKVEATEISIAPCAIRTTHHGSIAPHTYQRVAQIGAIDGAGGIEAVVGDVP
jgi:hypothetical protein